MNQFNPPRFIRPIRENQQQQQSNNAVTINGVAYYPAQQPQVVTNYATYDDGYRRYGKCLNCNTAYKIFTCFANSDKRCGEAKFGLPTHTHFTCQCGVITMEGSVRIGTKRDRIVYVPQTEQQQVTEEPSNGI